MQQSHRYDVVGQFFKAYRDSTGNRVPGGMVVNEQVADGFSVQGSHQRRHFYLRFSGYPADNNMHDQLPGH